MQRAKHADRKRETRTKIMIGEAAMRVGAAHLLVEEIEAVLAHYVETGGSKELQAKRPAEAMRRLRRWIVPRACCNDL